MGSLRWLLFFGFSIALGGLVGARVTRRASGSQAGVPTPWLKAATNVALASSVGLAVLVAGAGSFAAGLDAGRLAGLADSTPGLVALVEVGALAVALAAFVGGWNRAAGVALLAVPFAEGSAPILGRLAASASP